MRLGPCVIALKCDHFEQTLQFYQALGLSLLSQQADATFLTTGNVIIQLSRSLSQNHIVLQTAEPETLLKALQSQSSISSSNNQTHAIDAAGSNDVKQTEWEILDPNGQCIRLQTQMSEAQLKYNILNFALQQLFNYRAAPALIEQFQSQVVAKFSPKQVDTTFQAEPRPYPGIFTYCMPSSAEPDAANWYKTLGFELIGADQHIHLRHAFSDFDLMTFLEAPWLNFRGADVFELQKRMHDLQSQLNLPGEAIRYTEAEYGTDGAHWQSKDPEGNVVYFDTTDQELISENNPKEIRSLLSRCTDQLATLTNSNDCIDAIRKIESTLPAD